MPSDLRGTSLAAMSDRQVRMISAPLATVTQLVLEALGPSMGSPSTWTGAVRQALEPCDLAVLGPVYGRTDRPVYVPDSLLPHPHGFTSTFAEELERLAHAASQGLEADLVSSGQYKAPPWLLAAEAPARWLDAYILAMRRVWGVVKPLWQQSQPLLERELERVGMALASGSFTYLMARLSPRVHVEDDRCYIDASGVPAQIGTGLILQPIVTGPTGRLIGEEDGAITYIAYPLPGARRLDRRGPEAPVETRLSSLLGAPRAAILRRLDQPISAGQLAVDLIFAPSAITHHLIALERAGLAARERKGREVLVHRTARGTALLQVYEL